MSKRSEGFHLINSRVGSDCKKLQYTILIRDVFSWHGGGKYTD